MRIQKFPFSYILKLGLSPEIPTQYPEIRIIARDSIQQKGQKHLSNVVFLLITSVHFYTLGSIFPVNVCMVTVCTFQCDTLTGVLKTTGWIRHVLWQEQDLIRLLWTIRVSHVLITLNQTKLGAFVDLICYERMIRNLAQTTILSGSLSNLQHSHRIYLNMCTYTYVYTYLYICMFIHTSVFVYMGVHIYVYWGMWINVFISIYVCNDTRVQLHTYKQNVFMLWHIAAFWGWVKRLGCPCSTVQTSLHRVPMVRTSLEPAWPCFEAWCFLQIWLWKPLNYWWVLGTVEHFAQHCTWL